ncbi:hypothetical protein B0O99DRAFT_739973 [Bisporella sp. PMI_857]|nr:hypothetical protein B0O99DRAFT_739973 [Bisporella sp. PMI_857]
MGKFQDLPSELRRQIWGYTYPGPRKIERGQFYQGPTALHVNRDARAIALERYTFIPLLEYNIQNPRQKFMRSHPAGWIDFKNEIVYNISTVLATDNKEFQFQVRHVHLDVKSQWVFATHFYENHLRLFMNVYLNMETLDVTVHKYNSHESKSDSKAWPEEWLRQAAANLEKEREESAANGQVWRLQKYRIVYCRLGSGCERCVGDPIAASIPNYGISEKSYDSRRRGFSNPFTFVKSLFRRR